MAVKYKVKKLPRHRKKRGTLFFCEGCNRRFTRSHVVYCSNDNYEWYCCKDCVESYKTQHLERLYNRGGYF